MNHKKGMPANGTMLRASATVSKRVLSHAPPSSGSAGTESRTSTRLVMSRTEKTMPAIAAARAVFRRARVKPIPAS